jgi:hypothetical protein
MPNACYWEAPSAEDLEEIYDAIFLEIADRDGDGFIEVECGGDDWDDGPPRGACVNPDGWEGMICYGGSCPPVTDPPSSITIDGKTVWVCTAEYYEETKICAINCKDNFDNDQNGTADIEDPKCPHPAGLVPCGRMRDDFSTSIDESAPCSVCHIFVLTERIIKFLVLYIIIPFGILMIIVGGGMFLTSTGDLERIATSKKILKTAIVGLVIILSAWIIVNTVIFFLTEGRPPLPGEVAQVLGQPWHEVFCPVLEVYCP